MTATSTRSATGWWIVARYSLGGGCIGRWVHWAVGALGGGCIGRWVHWAVGALAITQPVLNLLDLKFSALGRQMYKTGTSSALWLTGARNSNRGREVLPRLG
jgi:hypothetical protein